MKVAFCLLVLAAAGLAASLSYAQSQKAQPKAQPHLKSFTQVPVKIDGKWIMATPMAKSPLPKGLLFGGHHAGKLWDEFKAMEIPTRPDPSNPPKVYVDPRPRQGSAFLAGG